MAVTAHIAGPATNPPNQQSWNVILHASPSLANASTGIPTAWVADAVLKGKIGAWGQANYDGKYFADAGTLYLVYSGVMADQTNGIMA